MIFKLKHIFTEVSIFENPLVSHIIMDGCYIYIVIIGMGT